MSGWQEAWAVSVWWSFTEALAGLCACVSGLCACVWQDRAVCVWHAKAVCLWQAGAVCVCTFGRPGLSAYVLLGLCALGRPGLCMWLDNAVCVWPAGSECVWLAEAKFVRLVAKRDETSMRWAVPDVFDSEKNKMQCREGREGQRRERRVFTLRNPEA